MNNVFWCDFIQLYKEKNYSFTTQNYQFLSYEEFYEIESSLYDLFVEKKGYCDFYINSVLQNFNTQRDLFLTNLSDKLNFSDRFLSRAQNRLFYKIYFCNVGIIYFVSVRETLLAEKKLKLSEVEEFKKHSISYLWNGLGREKNQLTKKRLEEFSSIIKLDPELYAENRKFLKAFAEISEEHGIDGITVERISEKVNLAKSSLYSIFDNKEDFIQRMFLQEMKSFMDVLFEKCKIAKNVDELAYLLLHVEKNYLDLKPALLVMHGWMIKKNLLVNQDFKEQKNKIDEFTKYFEEKFAVKNSSSNFLQDLNMRLFIGFASAQSGFAKIVFGNPKVKEIANSQNYADEIFNLIEMGIKNIEQY